MDVAIIYHPDCALHDTGGYHPERPERTVAIVERLRESPLNEQLIWHLAETVDLAHVEAVHDASYVRRIEEACLQGREALDHGDTHICPDSFAVARLSAGGAVQAVDLVMQGEANAAFSVMRPPGHHAEQAEAMGFCLFNNVAVAARYAQQEYDLERVAIIDFDVHHGNGTQAIFYRDPSVFFVSLHQFPFYPGTGSKREAGEGEGIGFTLNVPLPAGARYDEYETAWREEILPALTEFQPELILISAGFDAHANDPLANMLLRSEDYYSLTKEVVHFAQQSCDGRIVSVLEGGYNLEALAESAEAHVRGLCDGK
ncbi:MAG: histone deacetylase family protein [Puniceicoccales bacterium]